jgi:hypothetical protein
MKTSCPFIDCTFSIDENLAKIKSFEIRLDCYEEKCPAQFWEPLKCINPSAPDDQQRYLGGHCKWIVQICENCKDLHKCKKSGENKDSCRQVAIDSIFRVCEQKPKPVEQKPEPKPDLTLKPPKLKDSLSKDIPVFGMDKV